MNVKTYKLRFTDGVQGVCTFVDKPDIIFALMEARDLAQRMGRSTVRFNCSKARIVVSAMDGHEEDLEEPFPT
jgi:hypothetical protein